MNLIYMSTVKPNVSMNMLVYRACKNGLLMSNLLDISGVRVYEIVK